MTETPNISQENQPIFHEATNNKISLKQILEEKLADNKLTLANLQIDQLCSSDDFLNLACKSYKDPVVYDEFIPVARTISTHVENESSEFRYVLKRRT